MDSRFKDLLQTKMNRKEFLQYAGASLLAIIGVTGLLNSITKNVGSKRSSGGYGSSPYGGSSDGVRSKNSLDL